MPSSTEIQPVNRRRRGCGRSRRSRSAPCRSRRAAACRSSRSCRRSAADRRCVAPGDELAVRRVHRDDARQHLLEKRDRIVAADDRVRRIVLDAKRGESTRSRISGRRPPAARTRDTARCRPCSGSPCTARRRGARRIERAQQAVHGPLDAFRARQARAAPGRSACGRTACRASRRRSIAASWRSTWRARSAGIGMREVRREAQHRADLPGLRHRARHRIDVGVAEAAEEAVVVLDPLAAQRRRGRGSSRDSPSRR